MFEREREWAKSTGLKKGDRVQVVEMSGEPQYSGRVGEVDHIDDAGQVHGTWGGCALCMGDKFKKIS